MTTNESEWMTVEEAATLLELSSRQVNHLGNQQRIRTRRSGIRVLYHRGDVEQLARERISSSEPKTKLPRTEMMPVSQALEHIRHLENKLFAASERIGYLEAMLAQAQQERLDQAELKQLLDESDRDRTDLLARIAQLEAGLLNKPA